MCTAVQFRGENTWFGRTLDYEHGFAERILILPRKLPLSFRHEETMEEHYAMIGIGVPIQGYPLFFDAMNEHGLFMAGLNFSHSAVYGKPQMGRYNISFFELIPWVLSQCETVQDAKRLLQKTQITDTLFADDIPRSTLHWMVADETSALVVEAVAEGVKLYDNPVGVLTNEPPFPSQLYHLDHFLNLTSSPAQNTFAEHLPLHAYSRGMGAIGLPGDLSSASRFVRVAFNMHNAVCQDTNERTEFFHIMDSVQQSRGCCQIREGEYEITLYTAGYHAQGRTLYYHTYDNRQLRGVRLGQREMNAMKLSQYSLRDEENVLFKN